MRRRRPRQGGGGGWIGRHGAGAAPTFAALDLGTNNCRLLVAQAAPHGFQVVDAFSRIVRLGEGLESSGELCEAAVERTIRALRVCAGKMRRWGVAGARSVATEACRRASNCGTFLDRVRTETGIELEIISAGEEARLALAGVMPLLDVETPHGLVFDIGGGSTELVWLAMGPTGTRIVDCHSLPYGVITFAERHGSGHIEAPLYAAMVEEVEAQLRPFERSHRISDRISEGSVQMLGTSGTVTTVASIHLGLRRYDRDRVDGSHLRRSDIEGVNRRLSELSVDERAALPCVGRERADLVVAGCAILDAICRTWPAHSVRVADRGLREGILLGLIGAGAPASV